MIIVSSTRQVHCQSQLALRYLHFLSWRTIEDTHTWDDSETMRSDPGWSACLPRQLFIFRQSYANNLATTTCAHETTGKKEKWKVVKRRSLSMHKCLIQLHHHRASSACVRCDSTHSLHCEAETVRTFNTEGFVYFPNGFVIFTPSAPHPAFPSPLLAVHKTFARSNFKTKTILMLTWHIFNRCQSKFSCEKRVLDWDEVYYGCRRFSPCCCCAAAASQIHNVLNWIISSGSDPVQMTNRIQPLVARLLDGMSG